MKITCPRCRGLKSQCTLCGESGEVPEEYLELPEEFFEEIPDTDDTFEEYDENKHYRDGDGVNNINLE